MRRVVITGMGAVTPIGNKVDDMWKSLIENSGGIGPITRFDTSNCDVKLAAEVKDLDVGEYLKPIEIKKMDRFSQFAVVSALDAYNDSGLQDEEIDRERFSVIYSSGMGGSTLCDEYNNIQREGYESVSKMTIPMNLINMPAANIAIKLKAYGTCEGIATACASGTDSIGKAFQDIKNGYSDVVLAGATDAPIIPVFMGGFLSIGALSKATDPKRASIPFDKERSGFVMGEGAGSLILEEYEHARKRNAKIYAEVLGYGATCDGHSLTAPDFSLKQGTRAMQKAFDEAGIEAADISYINAHGTSTKYNDQYETQIIKNVFGDHSKDIPVSSTKSFTGHLLGAAGAIEAIISAKALKESYIPPTIGYQVADEECDLDYVVNNGRKKELKYVLSNSLGFGGHNAVIILGQGED